jgi:hypothetical protein
LVASNRKLAKQAWGDVLDPQQVRSLSEITRYFGFSIAMREILLLKGGWYVTHAGLVRLAKRRYCAGIDVEAVPEFCDPIAARWSFKATVYKSKNGRGFVGHGDADPSNVSFLVRGAEMRVAETRAVNRAPRKAYGIGICSAEELGSLTDSSAPSRSYERPVNPPPSNGANNGNGHPRLKDKLCLLIRQHNLDPTLVKAYAAHFCGTETLRGASRELVESFIAHLEKEAIEDRDRLICELNSFSHPVEVTS